MLIINILQQVKDKESALSMPSVQRILLLFYNTMSHDTLHTCLSNTKSLVHLRPRGLNCISERRLLAGTSVSNFCKGDIDFLSMINTMAENPRSLKEIARVAIYKSLDRELAQNVEELPIPLIVKRYLLDA